MKGTLAGQQRGTGAQEQQQEEHEVEEDMDTKHTPYAGGNVLAYSFARTTRHSRHGHGTPNTEHDFPVCR